MASFWRAIWAAMAVGALSACGQGASNFDEVRAPYVYQGTSLGIAHVAGQYQPEARRRSSFLLSGALDTQQVGARTLKVYLTPEYKTKYPGEWKESIRNLTDLASSAAYRELFALPFDTFVITTYSFAGGVHDAWRTTSDPAFYGAERAEMESLTRHLLTTYQGSHKTFVLQNWEGDWSLLGAYDPARAVAPETADRMVAWLDARQDGVSAARQAVAAKDVSVLHAVEVNRVLDAPGHTRVVNAVLPRLRPDAVSYSAWEALESPKGLDRAARAAAIHSRLGEAVGALRAAVEPGTQVYLGEVGFAENALDEAEVSASIEDVMDAATRLRLSHVVYWQIYDNECQGAGVECPGFWVVRPNGTWSSAGKTLNALALAAP